jgi:hypothetical protein
MARLYASGTTPKIPIYISVVATGAPLVALASGQPYFVKPDGTAVACTNTLVEVDATNAKGWYTLLVDAADALDAGDWTLSYQTPVTAANIGKAEFTIDAPVDTSAVELADQQGAVTFTSTESGRPAMKLVGEAVDGSDGLKIQGTRGFADVNLAGSKTISGNIGVLYQGTLASGSSAGAVYLASDASSVPGFYAGCLAVIVTAGIGGTANQVRTIKSYIVTDNGMGGFYRACVVDPPFTSNPGTSAGIVILPSLTGAAFPLDVNMFSQEAGFYPQTEVVKWFGTGGEIGTVIAANPHLVTDGVEHSVRDVYDDTTTVIPVDSHDGWTVGDILNAPGGEQMQLVSKSHGGSVTITVVRGVNSTTPFDNTDGTGSISQVFNGATATNLHLDSNTGLHTGYKIKLSGGTEIMEITAVDNLTIPNSITVTRGGSPDTITNGDTLEVVLGEDGDTLTSFFLSDDPGWEAGDILVSPTCSEILKVVDYDVNTAIAESGQVVTVTIEARPFAGTPGTIALAQTWYKLATPLVALAGYLGSNINPTQAQKLSTQALDSGGRAKVAAGPKLGEAFAFSFVMNDSTTHQPVGGKTVTCHRRVPGGAWANQSLAAGGVAPSEPSGGGNGSYDVTLGTDDMNAGVIVLRFTATGCDDRIERILTVS